MCIYICIHIYYTYIYSSCCKGIALWGLPAFNEGTGALVVDGPPICMALPAIGGFQLGPQSVFTILPVTCQTTLSKGWDIQVSLRRFQSCHINHIQRHVVVLVGLILYSYSSTAPGKIAINHTCSVTYFAISASIKCRMMDYLAT